MTSHIESDNACSENIKITYSGSYEKDAMSPNKRSILPASLTQQPDLYSLGTAYKHCNNTKLLQTINQNDNLSYEEAHLLRTINLAENIKQKQSTELERMQSSNSCRSPSCIYTTNTPPAINSQHPQEYTVNSNPRFPSASFHARKKKHKSQNRSSGVPKIQVEKCAYPEGVEEIHQSSELTWQETHRLVSLSNEEDSKMNHSRKEINSKNLASTNPDWLNYKCNKVDSQEFDLNCRIRDKNYSINCTEDGKYQINDDSSFRARNIRNASILKVSTSRNIKLKDPFLNLSFKHISWRLPCIANFRSLLLAMCIVLTICVAHGEAEVVACPFNKMCRCRYNSLSDDGPRTPIPIPLEVTCVGVPFAKIPSKSVIQ